MICLLLGYSLLFTVVKPNVPKARVIIRDTRFMLTELATFVNLCEHHQDNDVAVKLRGDMAKLVEATDTVAANIRLMMKKTFLRELHEILTGMQITIELMLNRLFYVQKPTTKTEYFTAYTEKVRKLVMDLIKKVEQRQATNTPGNRNLEWDG
ncbi:unnamed protein product [Fasciola hepatica]|uniref:Uncharacterized protein n=1 Tax=Fasciola hepatica TaxID=6192 RepID=A0ABC9HHR4_FASHE